MADIKDLFGGKKQAQMKMSGGQTGIPGLTMDTINTLPDMNCIKCGNKEFITTVRVKKLTKVASPTGQEGNINLTQLRCMNPNCRWIFNAVEWQNAQVTEDNNDIGGITDEEPKKEIKEENNRIVCRKCGEFYENGTEHTCKEK